MPRFAIEFPTVGKIVVMVEAETREDAVALVQAEGFEWDEEDEEDEFVHASFQLTGYQNQKAAGASKELLASAREVYGDDVQ